MWRLEGGALSAAVDEGMLWDVAVWAAQQGGEESFVLSPMWA